MQVAQSPTEISSTCAHRFPSLLRSFVRSFVRRKTGILKCEFDFIRDSPLESHSWQQGISGGLLELYSFLKGRDLSRVARDRESRGTRAIRSTRWTELMRRTKKKMNQENAKPNVRAPMMAARIRDF